MSGPVGGDSTAGYGLLGTLIAETANQNKQLTVLTEQASSGAIGSTYAALGGGAAVSLNLAPQIASLATWNANIGAAAGPMGVAQTAVTQIESIVSSFRSQLNGVNTLTSASSIESLATQARAALVDVGDLLNTQNGSTYVFAGQDSASPPVPDPADLATSGFFTQISTAVAGLSTSGAAATAAATLAIGTSNAAGTSPFSAYLSQPAASLSPPTAQIGPARTVTTGLIASANSAITSTGTSTTGSYMRDTLRALATIGSFSGSQGTDPGFAALVLDTQTSLTDAGTAMAGDAGVLGNTQASLTAQQSTNTDMTTALTTQVSTAQSVDMASTLSNLTQMQTQLQASYQLIAAASGLSLVKFLPVG